MGQIIKIESITLTSLLAVTMDVGVLSCVKWYSIVYIYKKKTDLVNIL
jgi:hypothetical protein